MANRKSQKVIPMFSFEEASARLHAAWAREDAEIEKRRGPVGRLFHRVLDVVLVPVFEFERWFFWKD